MSRFFLPLLAAVLALSAFAGTPPAAPNLRVMSFNVRVPVVSDGPNRWEARRDLMVRTIREQHPDVLGTQELHQEQGDYIVGKLPEYTWFGIDRFGGHADEHMGVFYRKDVLRLKDSGNYWLSDTPDQPGSITWGHPYPRMVTWALFEVKATGRTFYYLNTHLPYRPEDEPARIKGAQEILARLVQLPPDVPIVLTGDLNTDASSPTYALLAGALQDARASAPQVEGPAETFHDFTGHADQRIDFILSRGFRATRFATITTQENGRYPSDHFPVVADLSWKPASH
ncbi:endonuclease/exonuclease/phosphatase family protein [Dyella soli]|uniref:Endonuclease/exonuclease/phosphatase family protein n=1 Tax=Dyella soli TaxID=522319 RepID=A0A4R0YWA8_9GAMM|nr:endonuclease/exonuclease/phosphatase family protein [Dyella soli]TCI11283.1 endonuclease/exonuclease/phosphatase family protein [Dyella soli]